MVPHFPLCGSTSVLAMLASIWLWYSGWDVILVLLKPTGGAGYFPKNVVDKKIAIMLNIFYNCQIIIFTNTTISLLTTKLMVL